MAGGPSGLEVETASDAVDIEDFACEMEAWAEFAFHGFEVNFFEIYTAGGDEFIFVGAFAFDGECGLGELEDKFFEMLIGGTAPMGVLGDADKTGERFPVTFRDIKEGVLLDESAAEGFFSRLEFLFDGADGDVRDEIDLDFEFVIFFVKDAGAPRGEFEDGRAAESPVSDEEWAFGG